MADLWYRATLTAGTSGVAFPQRVGHDLLTSGNRAPARVTQPSAYSAPAGSMITVSPPRFAAGA
jgi:hypothetical protein